MFRLRTHLSCFVLAAAAFTLPASTVRAAADSPIYDDALLNNWGFWGWAPADLASTTTVHSGAAAIAVTAGAWEGFQLGHNWPANFDTTGLGNLTFWIHGGPTGGQLLQVYAAVNYAGQPPVSLPALAANTWQFVSIPLASLGADENTNVTSFVIQDRSGGAQPTFYLDDIVVTGSTPVVPPPPLVGMALYEDGFVNGWDNWSWAALNPANTAPVNSGTASVAVTASPWSALRFHHAALDTADYSSLTFWIHGGAGGGQNVQVLVQLSDVAQAPVALPPLAAGTWTKVTIPLADLGAANRPDLTDVWFQENAGLNQPTFYVDDVRLDRAPAPAVVHVSVDAKAKIREIDPRLFGLNTAIWDGAFNTATTVGLLDEAKNRALRFPGGSISDIYHWETNTTGSETWQWATSFDDFAAVATATDAESFIIVNYGTGTPEEAARWVRYANKTKRLGIKYWEVGNENYGMWEADENVRPHDPVTYATRFKEYYRQMKAVDRSIQVGAVLEASEDSSAHYPDLSVVNPRTGVAHSGWSAVMLATLKQLGVTPDFISYHRYEQGPGGENDDFLLLSSKGWAADAAKLRQMLRDYLGHAAHRVEITCTENNSVFGSPGKQTTSLVNGLFLADSLGNIAQTEFNAFFWWDLRNGTEAGNNNSRFLYGWRRYGDYGIVNAADPAGPADRYPTFYVYKLLQHWARGGERVVAATSDYQGLAAYAVRDRRGKTVNLLLINKHPTDTLNVTVAVDGFRVGATAKTFSYGIPQDEAARTGTGSADLAETTTTLSGNTFTFAPAPYSVTVLRLEQAKRGHGNGHDHDDEGDGDDDCD